LRCTAPMPLPWFPSRSPVPPGAPTVSLIQRQSALLHHPARWRRRRRPPPSPRPRSEQHRCPPPRRPVSARADALCVRASTPKAIPMQRDVPLGSRSCVAPLRCPGLGSRLGPPLHRAPRPSASSNANPPSFTPAQDGEEEEGRQGGARGQEVSSIAAGPLTPGVATCRHSSACAPARPGPGPQAARLRRNAFSAEGAGLPRISMSSAGKPAFLQNRDPESALSNATPPSFTTPQDGEEEEGRQGGARGQEVSSFAARPPAARGARAPPNVRRRRQATPSACVPARQKQSPCSATCPWVPEVVLHRSDALALAPVSVPRSTGRRDRQPHPKPIRPPSPPRKMAKKKKAAAKPAAKK